MILGENMDRQIDRRARTPDVIGMPGQSEANPQDRVKQLEADLMGIMRKLMSVPETDRHYAYRMRVNVDEVVNGIRDMLHP